MTINEQLTNLANQIKEQADKLLGLKENVKWLYKYGGSGTGSGGGGGDSSSTKTPTLVYQSSTGNLSAALGETLNNTVIIDEGTQTLNFYLRYLNTEHKYKITYTTNNVNWVTVTPDDDNTFVIPLSIVGNIAFKVKLQDITDNAEGPATIAVDFITNPITINTYLQGITPNGATIVQDEIFMQNYSQINTVIEITPHIAGSFTATCNVFDTPIELSDLEIDKTITITNVLHDSAFLADSSNTGAYSVKYSIEFNSTISGKQSKELEQPYTLIPNSTYVIVKTETGTMYSTKPTSGQYEFSAGSISFIGYIYKGSNDGESFQQVTAKIYTDTGEELYDFNVTTPVTERANFLSGTKGTFYFNNDYITSTQGNWFEVRVGVGQNVGDTLQYQSYYLFVKKNSNVLNWYPSSGGVVCDYYFNKENKSSSIFPQDSLEVACSLSTDVVNYSWSLDSAATNAPESQVAIALSVDEDNDDVLLATLNTNSAEPIYIYQNKIQLSTSGSIEIYYPMDSTYHLLQLYGRIVRVQGNTLYYEWVAYIDGIIEGALSIFSDHNIAVTGITLNPDNLGVFTMNHFNYTVFNCQAKKSWDSEGYVGLRDTNIVEYYYKYLCATNNSYNEEDYAGVIQAFNKVNYSYTLQVENDESSRAQDQLTILSASDVATLQLYGGLPTLIFQIKGDDILNTFFKNMQGTFTEEQKVDEIKLNNIQYYKAFNTTAEKQDVSDLEDLKYYYSIQIQGSSTKGYKFKNWELSINTDDSLETIPIFSLNYEGKDSDGKDVGFFPEQSFTLKADIVDSSHSVNTTIGSFVNDNCTPFNTGYKNCLSGTPMLVLVEKVSDSEASKFYFLGIYNYNLGRNSKFNLNYADRPKIDSKSKGFIVRTTNSTQTKPTYASAEIANNSCFWDFSQYDKSILFENNYKMEDGSAPSDEFLSTHTDSYYMWGDLVKGSDVPIDDTVQACVKSISRAGGFLFDWLGKNFSTDAYFTELDTSSSSLAWKQINTVPDSKKRCVRKVKYNDITKSYSYIFDIPSSDTEEPYNEQDLIECIYGTYDEDNNTKTYPTINYKSVMEYYVIMQAFGLVDSPMKNLNIKTWNYDKDKGSTFYAAFYDMDTGLGGDNAGSLTISPFAFSDYWQTDDSGKVTRHLDYWSDESGEVGFDVPSSFLFAIGKYAAYYQQAHPLVNLGDTLVSPMDFWAKLRQKGSSLENTSAFINNYFNKNFKDTHPIIWNMNYRSKYLIQVYSNSSNSLTLDTTQISKFHGRRLNRIKAWVNNRMHMLDAYFNINNLPYSPEGNSNINLAITNPINLDGLNLNTDVILLQNIFASTGADTTKTSTSINCKVTALDYSPFIASSTNATSDIRLFNSGNEYEINIGTTGNQSIIPYGGTRWTSIDTVNSFVANNQPFYIANNYIKKLICNIDYTTNVTPTSWELHTPKMQEVHITGKTFKNTLQIYPGTALTYLDLSNTAINFVAQESGNYNVCPNLQKIILNNFKGSVTLRNCNLLKDIQMNNATMSALEINPYQGNCNFSNTNIKTLNITSISENSVFQLEEDTTITNLILSGFKSVTVNRCSSLKNITLNGTLPETIKITNCFGGITFNGTNNGTNINNNGTVTFTGVKTLNFDGSKFDSSITTIVADSNLTSVNWAASSSTIYSSEITFDLTNCGSLTEANFSQSSVKNIKFATIYIDGDKVKFQRGNMQSITGNLVITHSNGWTFDSCYALSNLGNISFSSDVTSAVATFRSCGKLNSIQSLIWSSSITNISRMFEGTAFTNTNLLSNAIGNNAATITNISGCFQGSKVTDYSAFLSKSWDGITSRTNMLGACNSNVSYISTKMTKNYLTFNNALTVDPLCIFQTIGSGGDCNTSTIIPFEETSLSATTTTTLDFQYIGVIGINNTNFLTNASKCIQVSNLEFINATTWDHYTSTTNLTFGDNTHIEKFYNCIQNYAVNTSTVGSFFKNFNYINSSLNALTITSSLPIASFVDYSKFKTQTSLFSTNFNIEKTITQEEFITLVNTIFDSTDNNLTTINGVFKNCTIICTEDTYADKVLNVPIPANSKIKDISSMFEKCHAFYTDTTEVKNRIYLNFISGENIGFSNLSGLAKCSNAWQDCYINKLSSTWFANVENQLSLCNDAFAFAQFNQRYSDDWLEGKVAYDLQADIYLGNQVNVSSDLATTLNSNVSSDFRNTDGEGHCIIPAQFFYYEDNGTFKNKTNSEFNCNEIFMASNLYGLLPDKLFAKNELPTSKCSGMFKFCTIIPYYVKSIYQTIIPSTWSYSLGEEVSKTMLQHTTFKIDIYCITPDGTQEDDVVKPYLTGALGDAINGAVIVPTIHQVSDVVVKWKDIWDNLNEDTINYINLDLTPSTDIVVGEDINIGTIDFIYQYNQNSLSKDLANFANMLPNSIGIDDDYINNHVSLNWDRQNNNIYNAWDYLRDSDHKIATFGPSYRLQWAYNYRPTAISDIESTNTLYKNIEGSDELFKIHYGVQYNGGNNVLIIDDTNTDGFTSNSKTLIKAAGLINDKAALLLYGPIFHKDLLLIKNIDNSTNNKICSNLIDFGYGTSYASPTGGMTTSTSESGKRFYQSSSSSNILKAYDLSRNLVLPAASNAVTAISNVIEGKSWKEGTQAQTAWIGYRYYTSRISPDGITANYKGLIEIYQ